MSSWEQTVNRGAGRRYALRANLEALVLLALVLLALVAVAGLAPTRADAGPTATKLIYAPGRIVPIPASIPHEAGDMVDRRILPDLLWIARRYPIYITDGYSGPLPGGGHAGCFRCHTPHSDHYNGVAVDIVPVGGSTRCDRSWRPITRLAHWAEPVQNQPRPPFRWVGYDGDAGHGCGNHLHLSWNHAPAPEYQLAEWVEVFPSKGPAPAGHPAPSPGQPSPGAAPPKPGQPTPGAAPPNPGQPPQPTPSSPAPEGPSGGISQVRTGGVSVRRD